jgi:hypothetical protein
VIPKLSKSLVTSKNDRVLAPPHHATGRHPRGLCYLRTTTAGIHPPRESILLL